MKAQKVKKLKPLTSVQKKVLRHLALALVVADMENQVIKPAMAKEGKPFKEGEFRRTYFKQLPQVAQAERAFNKAIQEASRDIKQSLERNRGSE